MKHALRLTLSMILVVSFQMAQLKALKNKQTQYRLMKSNQYKNDGAKAVLSRRGRSHQNMACCNFTVFF
jgi:hypothetical protein